MANIITGIYVSIDGLEYTKLDLHKDEAINMKHTQKDLQNLSKIFSPYSQGFTFPSTPKNRAAFGFFGDTDVIKINVESKFSAKLYINGILNNTGFIQLSKISYKKNKPIDFTGAFVTTMTNLKDRIGEDLLSELTDLPAIVKWNIGGVQDMVRSSQTIVVDGVLIKYFIPLISINRVWQYEQTDNSEFLDNIAYKNSSSLLGSNLIRPEELRPCISYDSILNLIKKKYDLTVISPLEERDELLDLRVWCNAERISNGGYRVLPINRVFGRLRHYGSRRENKIPDPKKYTVDEDLVNNTITVNKRPLPFQNSNEYVEDAFQFRIKFEGVTITGYSENPEVNIQYIRKSDDVILLTEVFALEGNTFECIVQMDDTLFGVDDELEFYVKVKFEQPTSWANCDFRIYFRYYDDDTGFLGGRVYAWYYYDSLANNNSSQVSTDDIDLIKSLPEIKVIDFLNSHFKMFNISVFDTSPDDENLYWLTPEDINSSREVYSKAVFDYTRYLDSKAYDKEKPNDFNFYNFKHATSDYFSNKKFIEAFGLEFGQVTFPETQPTDLKEFKVETGFSILPPIQVNGAIGLETAYGFTDDPPEINEAGETRYTPNFDELTIFYTHGSTNVTPLGMLGEIQFQYAPNLFFSIIGVYALSSYIKVLPWSKKNKSLGFSILKHNNIEYPNSLFIRFYSEQTIRLLNPNVLSQKFNLILPPNEIYLNESTTVQGAGKTPSGFRLQNDIIIGENLFSIVDATIDQTTGKTKMTLLNY